VALCFSPRIKASGHGLKHRATTSPKRSTRVDDLDLPTRLPASADPRQPRVSAPDVPPRRLRQRLRRAFRSGEGAPAQARRRAPHLAAGSERGRDPGGRSVAPQPRRARRQRGLSHHGHEHRLRARTREISRTHDRRRLFPPGFLAVQRPGVARCRTRPCASRRGRSVARARASLAPARRAGRPDQCPAFGPQFSSLLTRAHDRAQPVREHDGHSAVLGRGRPTVRNTGDCRREAAHDRKSEVRRIDSAARRSRPRGAPREPRISEGREDPARLFDVARRGGCASRCVRSGSRKRKRLAAADRAAARRASR